MLKGFNFAGGLTLSPEFAALLAGLVIYTSAFIAERRVRASRSTTASGKAAGALGLRCPLVLRLVESAAAAARHHPADDQPVPQPQHEQARWPCHRLSGHRVGGQHHDAEPHRPGRPSHSHHHGQIHGQPVDLDLHELVQQAHRAER